MPSMSLFSTDPLITVYVLSPVQYAERYSDRAKMLFWQTLDGIPQFLYTADTLPTNLEIKGYYQLQMRQKDLLQHVQAPGIYNLPPNLQDKMIGPLDFIRFEQLNNIVQHRIG